MAKENVTPTAEPAGETSTVGAGGDTSTAPVQTVPTPDKTAGSAADTAPAGEPSPPAAEPTFEPTWLDQNPSAPPQAAQPAQQQPQRGFQQPVQQPPGQVPSQVDFDRLVENPQSVIDSRIAQGIAPVMQTVQQIGALLQRQLATSMEQEARQTQEAVRKTYKEVFSKDRYFSGNEKVRTLADSYMRDLVTEAQRRAVQGDPTMLREIRDPSIAQAVLAAARSKAGIPLDATMTPVAAATDAASATGAMPRGEQPGTAKLTDSELEAIKRAGITPEEYIAAKEEADKYNF